MDYEDSGFYRKLKSLRIHFTFSDIRQALRKPRRFWDRWSLIFLSFMGPFPCPSPVHFHSVLPVYQRSGNQTKGRVRDGEGGEE